MGERKGVNKYYPPDYDPAKGGLNKFLGTHALRERARKIHLGIIIIRFEMPYNIWCDGCQNHIGMGVRYNAEKTKVGMYYTTPIYQFRMKCHLCDNYFEIKTDPANLEYVIVSGARRQENRWDPADNEQVVTEDKSVIRKIASDAMFSLEHGTDDKDRQKEVNAALTDLEELQSSRWKDDFSANMALRQKMRKLKDEQSKYKQHANISVPLLAPSKEDERMAAVLKLSQVKPTVKSKEERQKEINSQSVLEKFNPDRRFEFLSKKNSAGSTLKNAIKSTQKTFSNFSSNFHHANLGIQLKSNKISTKQESSNYIQEPGENRNDPEKLGEESCNKSIVSYENSDSD